MLTKAVLPLGAAVALTLSATVVLGVALELWAAAALAGCLLVSLALLVSLDAWRRVRGLRAFVREEIGRAAARQAKESSAVDSSVSAPADVLEAVRLLQAQYVGRLERLQVSVESLAEHTVAERAGEGGSSSQTST
ncbi:MAG: hypothetical protein ACR2FV_05205 [Ornithinimicrobium sp.]|uniref:hypothetical protein n=1 Tax=Ornithinimicrobium sp. TaxID=1977084 RepID=UPI003D9AF93F